MTITTINAVGFCAHYSEQGDWAFGRALTLAQSRNLKLNIFHFVQDPYKKAVTSMATMSPEERNRLVIGGEKELRLYYDDKLGDYLNAGFRLCEDNGWTELHRCICRREFQILFLPYPERDAEFAGRPLTAFAEALVCPAVLVGPARSDEVYLNAPAELVVEHLQLEGTGWSRLDSILKPAGRGDSIVAHPANEGLDCR